MLFSRLGGISLSCKLVTAWQVCLILLISSHWDKKWWFTRLILQINHDSFLNSWRLSQMTNVLYVLLSIQSVSLSVTYFFKGVISGVKIWPFFNFFHPKKIVRAYFVGGGGNLEFIWRLSKFLLIWRLPLSWRFILLIYCPLVGYLSL